MDGKVHRLGYVTCYFSQVTPASLVLQDSFLLVLRITCVALNTLMLVMSSARLWPLIEGRTWLQATPKFPEWNRLPPVPPAQTSLLSAVTQSSR